MKPTSELRFGYYRRLLTVTSGRPSIETLPDLEATVSDIDSDSQVDGGRIYVRCGAGYGISKRAEGEARGEGRDLGHTVLPI